MVDPGSGSQREVAGLMLTRYAIALPLSLEPTSSWIQAPQTRPIAAQGNALGMPRKNPTALKGRPNSCRHAPM